LNGTQEFRDLFVAEAQENIQALTDGALRLERSAEDINAVHDLFRAAHTMKGMAATMGYDGLTQLCHSMEDTLDGVRSGQQAVTSVLVDGLLAASDAMTRMVGLVAAGGDGGEADPALLLRFKTLAEGSLPAQGAPAMDPLFSPPLNSVTETHPVSSSHGGATVVQGLDPNLPSFDDGRQAVARAFADGGDVAKLSVSLEPTCSFKGVRALLVRKALERLGTVACTWPAGRALEEGAFELNFEIWVASSAGLEELETAALRVMEVAMAHVVWLPRPATGQGAPRSVAAQPAAPVVDALPTAADLAPEMPEAPEPVAESNGFSSAAPQSAGLPGGQSALAPVVQANRQTLRVSVERLDKVMNLVGELVTAKIRLSQIARNRGLKDLSEALLQVDHVVNELQEEVTAARMVPMEQIFSRFPRLMRDLSRELGKPMELVLEGKEIELDRSILDEIGEALVHLLRNSADHGIEVPEERRRLGKPATGTIRLEAKRDKNQVLISVEDDGGGIRTDKVRQSAVRKGLLTQEAANLLSDEEAVALIFTPGFSTADQVTTTSGRGVGVDAVRAKVESLGGNLRVENYPGQGTRFRIRLPLTLAIIQALRVRVGEEEYMAPVVNVVEAVEFERSDLKRTHGLETVMLRDEVLPVTRLRGLLGLDNAQVPANFTLLVAESGEHRSGLMVDEVLGQQEIAIKSMGKTLKAIRGFGGVTIMGDGTVCLILDLPSLLEL
jgi:two-component system chemotaxis sensor kinase CheA